MMTEAEYLEFERNSDIKHEYYRGEVFAMAGASPNHNRLTVKLLCLIDIHLDGKDCEAFGGEMLVKIEASKDRFYPDLSVVCGDSVFTDDTPQALLNPTLIIEVLSPSTEQFDRGAKFRKYRQLESLREYVLVSQELVQIERFYLKEGDIWEFVDISGLDSNITLKSIDCTFSLADVYANVVFEPDEP